MAKVDTDATCLAPDSIPFRGSEQPHVGAAEPRSAGVYLVEKILKKKGNKLFIKWLGLPTHQNSWIKTSDIV
ncbi:hypothetical protein NQ315_002866 [Exocentrus adspersus]|uniref:Chromo domain-containing protein n=1 Tax=Exocentrus adspersus TaxID=1586481 RepID=A0AAV8V8D7_9CUCU|nr:hypothetical protein NQ315_002866 [Exocentrus adspersus]